MWCPTDHGKGRGHGPTSFFGSRTTLDRERNLKRSGSPVPQDLKTRSRGGRTHPKVALRSRTAGAVVLRVVPRADGRHRRGPSAGTWKTTTYSHLSADVREGVRAVAIPESGDTSAITSKSHIEDALRNGVSHVRFPKRNHT